MHDFCVRCVIIMSYILQTVVVLIFFLSQFFNMRETFNNLYTTYGFIFARQINVAGLFFTQFVFFAQIFCTNLMLYFLCVKFFSITTLH